jgi:hypothetical protein
MNKNTLGGINRALAKDSVPRILVAGFNPTPLISQQSPAYAFIQRLGGATPNVEFSEGGETIIESLCKLNKKISPKSRCWDLLSYEEPETYYFMQKAPSFMLIGGNGRGHVYAGIGYKSRSLPEDLRLQVPAELFTISSSTFSAAYDHLRRLVISETAARTLLIGFGTRDIVNKFAL